MSRSQRSRRDPSDSLSHEIAELVDLDAVAGGDEGGRVVLNDNRAAFDPGASRKARALVDRGHVRPAVPADITALKRLRRAPVRGGRTRPRFRRLADHARSGIDELDRGAAVAVAVNALVGLGERVLDAAAKIISRRRQLDRDLIALARVAHVGGVGEPRVPDSLLARPPDCLGAELLEGGGEARFAGGVEPRVDGPDEVGAEVAEQAAETGKRPRRRRHDYAAEAGLASEVERVRRTGASVSEESEVARVRAALGHEREQSRVHIRRRHLEDRLGGVVRIEAEPLAEPPAGSASRAGIERELATEEAVGGDDAERDVAVGH